MPGFYCHLIAQAGITVNWQHKVRYWP